MADGTSARVWGLDSTPGRVHAICHSGGALARSAVMSLDVAVSIAWCTRKQLTYRGTMYSTICRATEREATWEAPIPNIPTACLLHLGNHFRKSPSDPSILFEHYFSTSPSPTTISPLPFRPLQQDRQIQIHGHLLQSPHQSLVWPPRTRRASTKHRRNRRERSRQRGSKSPHGGCTPR